MGLKKLSLRVSVRMIERKSYWVTERINEYEVKELETIKKYSIALKLHLKEGLKREKEGMVKFRYLKF